MNDHDQQPPRRRLSILRVFAALVLLGVGFGAGTRFASDELDGNRAEPTAWFAPYVDVTLPPTYDFQDPAENPSKYVVLGFVVGLPQDGCTPSWGASYTLDDAGRQLDLDRRIALLRQTGGDAVVSFGGVANTELANGCSDPVKLADAYRSVIQRYDAQTVDLDLEGAALDDAGAMSRRADAIAEMQGEAKAAGHALHVWLTLPVAPSGLPAGAVAALDAMLAAHVDVAGVNLMTMDFGGSRAAGQDMVAASLAAVDAAARQVTTSYQRVGVVLDGQVAYAKLGVTPMIGQNGIQADRLDTDSARRLFDEAGQRGVGRFSMWSLNRDTKCSPNVVVTSIASNTCSGVDQAPLEFSKIFGAASGTLSDQHAPPVTVQAAPLAGRVAVTPTAATGPYEDWRPRREYDTGSKVVRDGMVYEAKWWNVASPPDQPVANEWDTPWRVIGPVLAQDGPPPAPATVPAGTYPEWDGLTVYYAGDRVEHLGVAYRAKWWTRGDDPSIDVDNDWETPWAPIDPSTITTAPPADSSSTP